ncbi:MAG: MoaD/ThiS family protein [Planctomyces sp.]|nr:MoaD/ThiS family protein [Planctomyces sp.]
MSDDGPELTVQIPASLRRLTGGAAQATARAATVRDLVAALDAQFPGLRDRLCEGDRLRTGLAVAVNSRICSTGLSTPLPAGADVTFLPTVSGG